MIFRISTLFLALLAASTTTAVPTSPTLQARVFPDVCPHTDFPTKESYRDGVQRFCRAYIPFEGTKSIFKEPLVSTHMMIPYHGKDFSIPWVFKVTAKSLSTTKLQDTAGYQVSRSKCLYILMAMWDEGNEGKELCRVRNTKDDVLFRKARRNDRPPETPWVEADWESRRKGEKV